MCPGQRAVIFPGLRLFSPPGSMKRRLPRPSRVRCRLTVRRSITKPILTSSSVIRCADHLSSRRQDSICSMTHAGVAFGLRCGLDGRSCNPASPWSRQQIYPLAGACARDTHLSGDVGKGTCLAPLHEPPTALDAQGRIAWGTRRPLEVRRRQARHLSCAPAALRPFSPAVRRGYGSRQDRLRRRSARTPHHEARAGS